LLDGAAAAAAAMAADGGDTMGDSAVVVASMDESGIIRISPVNKQSTSQQIFIQ